MYSLSDLKEDLNVRAQLKLIAEQQGLSEDITPEKPVIILTPGHYTGQKAQEYSWATRLIKNYIIMGRRGEMGRTAPITDKENGWLCGTGSIFFRLKPEFDAVLYSKILSSPDVVHYLEENATGTTMKNLNEDIVKHIPVPYITKQMQKEITNQIEMKMSVCDSIEKTVNECLQQAEAMRQSILKKAFEGAL